MTIIEHGLYGGAIAYAISPDLFLLGIVFGVLPDVVPIALAIKEAGVKKVAKRILQGGKDDLPEYVYKVYDVSHSFVTAAALALVLLFLDRRLLVLAAAYGFHILCDIPLHDSRFSTRFLYPLTNFHIRGYSETRHKWVIAAQYPVILAIYVLLLRR